MTAPTPVHDGAPAAAGASPDAVVAPAAQESRRRTKTRERLVDAAYQVFAEVGVHVATVEQICDRAGFTRGAFYSNFTSKEELFFALMEREHAIRLASLEARVDELRPELEAADPLDEDSLGDLVLQFLAGPFDNRTWCLVYSEFLMLAMRDPGVAPEFLAFQDRFEASLEPIVERALERAHREFVVDPRTALRMLQAMHLDAVRTAILTGREGDSPDADEQRVAMARTVLVLTRPVR